MTTLDAIVRASAAGGAFLRGGARPFSAAGAAPRRVVCAGVAPAFDDLSLDELRARRSAKWATYPADVLPAWVAEMDFALAEPVRAALQGALDRDDCGYPSPGALGDAFAGFAGRRHGWSVDPAAVMLAGDVVVAIAESLRLLTAPGDGVVVNPPVYPPFFSTIRALDRRVVEA